MLQELRSLSIYQNHSEASMTKILYLEDEHFLGRIVKESLASRGYTVELVSDGAHYIKQFEIHQPDICILDIMVPHVDGYTIASQVRKMKSEIPIIFLSAKNQTKDVIKGFKTGGNDYIKKPFSMEELIVRIENLLALHASNTTAPLPENQQIGQYIFDYKSLTLTHNDGNEIILSHRENELLYLFCKYQNQQIERKAILKELWGDDNLFHSRNLDVYVRKIRVYLQKDTNIQLVTLRGVGYKFLVKED